MHQHPNAALVRKAYAALRDRDLAAVHEILADDVVWHEPGRSVIAGDYKGPDEIVGFLQKLHELSAGTIAVELVDLLVDAERVTAFQRVTAERGSMVLDIVDVVDFEIHLRRVTEVTVYQSDTYAFDEFWA